MPYEKTNKKPRSEERGFLSYTPCDCIISLKFEGYILSYGLVRESQGAPL